MIDTIKQLENMLQFLEAEKLIQEADYGSLDSLNNLELDEAKLNFELLFNHPCPKSLCLGLLLPDTVSVLWKLNDKIMGEYSLSNHFLSFHRVLDNSFHTLKQAGIQLSKARIVDAVVLSSGPIYTITTIDQSQGISENLYCFNTRETFKLDINYSEYVEQLIITKGISYWQYLFCLNIKLSGYEKSILKQEINFLETRFPHLNYHDLWARLDARS